MPTPRFNGVIAEGDQASKPRVASPRAFPGKSAAERHSTAKRLWPYGSTKRETFWFGRCGLSGRSQTPDPVLTGCYAIRSPAVSNGFCALETFAPQVELLNWVVIPIEGRPRPNHGWNSTQDGKTKRKSYIARIVQMFKSRERNKYET